MIDGVQKSLGHRISRRDCLTLWTTVSETARLCPEGVFYGGGGGWEGGSSEEFCPVGVISWIPETASVSFVILIWGKEVNILYSILNPGSLYCKVSVMEK